MKFDFTIEKTAEAVIDRNLCINCGDCRDLCPTGAIGEYQKAMMPMNCCGENFTETLADAKRRAVESACSVGCPMGIIPQAVAAFVEKGQLVEAAEHIRTRNPLPGVCAMVCDHLCQETCKRLSFGDAPLNMKALERTALENVSAQPIKYIRKYYEKIAIIGGGPAGLSAAFSLAKAGYPVTIFEKDQALGGALRWGIPAFRLDKEMLSAEIERIISAGIDVRYGWHIGENHSIDELWDEGFDACLIAVGTSYGKKIDVKGVDSNGVYDGVKVMRQITGGEDEGVEIGDKVVVVGGGGFAADLARVLRRMDKEVLCVIDEKEDELQIPDDLVSVLEKEGVDLRFGTTLQQIIAEDGNVKAVELLKGNAVNYFCDTVVFAVGQKTIVENICNAETYPNGMVKIDGRYSTNKEMVFACGDATGETESVIEAMGAGKEVAMEINRVLQGIRRPEKARILNSAPEGFAVYEENVDFITTQIEKPTDTLEPVEEIMAVLRAAGIEEEMESLSFAEDAKAVAVVGGGIAGITAALALARKGYKVTILEKEAALGGSYRWLATEKRIDKKVLAKELEKIEAAGINVMYNVTGGVRPNIEQLSKMGFDAVLFALGDHGGRRQKIEGIDAAGVFDMTAVMGKLVGGEKVAGIGRRVLVAGGDEITFDIARMLKPSCEEVTVIAPWSRGSLETKTGAVDIALSEGVNMVTGVEVVSTEVVDGKIVSADCKVIEQGYTINVPCDTLIVGGGGPDTQTIAIRNLELDMEEKGYIAVNHKMESSIKGVFAIGNLDMSAADAGRAGATAVDNYLMGKDGYISMVDTDKTPMPTTYEIIEGARAEEVIGFAEGLCSLSVEEAMKEASRCMKCGYHKLQAEMCMGCGICERVCPVNAVAIKEV